MHLHCKVHVFSCMHVCILQIIASYNTTQYNIQHGTLHETFSSNEIHSVFLEKHCPTKYYGYPLPIRDNLQEKGAQSPGRGLLPISNPQDVNREVLQHVGTTESGL